MPESSPPPSRWEERLAEMDRRLAEIQAELEPDRPVDGVPAAETSARRRFEAREESEERLAPPSPRPPPTPPRPGAPADPLTLGLIKAVRALLGGYEAALAGGNETTNAAKAGGGARVGVVAGGGGVRVGVVAGPLAGHAELQSFRQALSAIPGVASVTVRQLVGEDEAMLDVRLR